MYVKTREYTDKETNDKMGVKIPSNVNSIQGVRCWFVPNERNQIR